MTEQKVKILEIKKTGRFLSRNRKNLMIVEDELKGDNPRRFHTAIAPINFPAKVGEYIFKTKEVNYVGTHPETINETREMYEKLVKESK
jgi:hypothetical protein